MEAKNVIDEALALPAADRLELLQKVWDSLLDPDGPQLTEEQKRELDRQYAEYLHGPAEGEKKVP